MLVLGLLEGVMMFREHPTNETQQHVSKGYHL